jgi:hypothetical protein
METVEKQTAVFPPFPQPLLLLLTIRRKAAEQEQPMIVYTKCLTLPWRKEQKLLSTAHP